MKLIFNPFTRIAGLPALSFGTLFLLVGAMLAGFFNARYDGILDLHFGHLKSFGQPLKDQILVWFSLVCVFYITALVMRSRPRFIDIAGTFAFSRLPFAFLPLINMTGFFTRFTDKLKVIDLQHPVLPFTTGELGLFILFSIVILAFAAWLVTLYFNAYKTCTNLKGNQLVSSFITGIVIAEIISIYLTRNLFI